MLLEYFVGLCIASPLVVEGAYFKRCHGDKFADCECEHLPNCLWAPPEEITAEEVALLDGGIAYFKQHAWDDEAEKLKAYKEMRLKEAHRPRVNYSGYDWGYRMERTARCKRICRHRPGCNKVTVKPYTYQPPAGSVWSQERNRYEDSLGYGVELVAAPNPKYDEIAWRPKNDEEPKKRTAAQALAEKRASSSAEAR